MKDKIRYKLGESAWSYLVNGLSLFHQIRNVNENFQVSLGNIAISIELILKTLIAENCFPFLYTNLPLDLRLKLTYPEIEKRNPILKLAFKELESFSFDTLQLDNCISIFYTIYPEKKQEYKAYFRYLSNIRNLVVHGAIPSYKKYDLEKISFFAIDLMKFLQIIGTVSFKYRMFQKEDEIFYKDFDALRVKRVEEAIEKAKKRLSDVNESLFLIAPDGWDIFVCKCPICNSEATFNGYCDILIEPTYDGEEAYLKFYADSFKCNECGLELLDNKELALAGLETVYDRSEDDLELFIEQNREYLESLY